MFLGVRRQWGFLVFLGAFLTGFPVQGEPAPSAFEESLAAQLNRESPRGKADAQFPLLREGIWPSGAFFEAGKVLDTAESFHGFRFPEGAVSEILASLEDAKGARELVRYFDASWAHNGQNAKLRERGLKALRRVRAAEGTLVALSRTVIEQTLPLEEREEEGAVDRAVAAFLENPAAHELFPTHPDYTALLAGLQRLQETRQQGNWDALSLGERFTALGWGDAANPVQVTQFQIAHRLLVTGQLDGDTEKVLALDIERLIGLVEDSLLRWRRSPLRHQKAFLRVNIAAYQAELWRDGEHTKTFRVVVGDLEGETPEFVRHIDEIVLNPPWYVPDAVRQRDLKKRVARNPEFYKENGFRLIQGGRKLVQSPGEHNWLGRVIFRWDRGGTDSVYIHDSPFQERFSLNQRSLSHGCVNMEGAREFALELAEWKAGMTEQQFFALFDAGKTRKIPLKEGLLVSLEYMTVVPGPDGQLVFLPDIYGRTPAPEDDVADSGGPGGL